MNVDRRLTTERSRRPRTWLSAIGPAIFLLATSGCPRNLNGSPSDADDPVRIDALHAAFTPGDHADFDVSFSVASPGLQAGAVTSVQWEVWLGNRWFASGTQQLAEPLPDKGRHTFSVKLPVVFRRGAPASDEDVSVDFGIRGGLIVQTGGDLQRLPFQFRQRMNVRYAPQPSLDADSI